MKFFLAPFVCWAVLVAAPLRLVEGPAVQSVLDHISADSLRGNLSFLASDALEGRDTPSRGLDIAAEFIASQFRRAGLEPVANDSYFQTADFVQLSRRTDGLSLTIDNPGSPDKVDIHSLNSSVIAAASSYCRKGIYVALDIQQHD